MQVPDKSTVLLVIFQPTVAFYTFQCMQMLSLEPGSAVCYDSNALPELAMLACSCAAAMAATPASVADLSSLLPSDLLPEASLPVSKSAAYMLNIAGDSQLKVELKMCMVFLLSLLQPSSATKSLHLLLPAATPAPAQLDTQASAVLRLRTALGGVVLTSKLFHLVQQVKREPSLKNIHVPLLMVTSKLLTDVQHAAGKLTDDSTMQEQALYSLRSLIEALMQNALSLLQQAVQQTAGQTSGSDDRRSGPGVAEEAVRCCFYSLPMLRLAALDVFWDSGMTLSVCFIPILTNILFASNAFLVDCVSRVC